MVYHLNSDKFAETMTSWGWKMLISIHSAIRHWLNSMGVLEPVRKFRLTSARSGLKSNKQTNNEIPRSSQFNT